MSQFTAENYQQALQALIPTGLAWPRDPGGVQAAVIRALAAGWQRGDNDAVALLAGDFPQTA